MPRKRSARKLLFGGPHPVAYHSRRTCRWRYSANASAKAIGEALTMIAR